MIDFNFEHFFEKEPDFQEEPELQEETNNQITYREKPSLAFLEKMKLPSKSHFYIDKLSLSPDVKQFFKPNIEDKKEIIEDFLMWAHEKEISADNSGTLLMYIRELKDR